MVLFCGFAYQVGRLVLGTRSGERPQPVDGETADWGMVATIVAAGAAVVSAFYLPAPHLALVRAAAQVVAGGAR